MNFKRKRQRGTLIRRIFNSLIRIRKNRQSFEKNYNNTIKASIKAKVFNALKGYRPVKRRKKKVKPKPKLIEEEVQVFNIIKTVENSESNTNTVAARDFNKKRLLTKVFSAIRLINRTNQILKGDFT